MTDAQVLRNKNFKTLIESDDNFKALFTKENFALAVRDYVDFIPVVNGIPYKKIFSPNLNEILEGLISWNETDAHLKTNSPQYIDFLQQKADLKPYQYLKINEIYGDDVLELFNSDSSRVSLGDKVSNTIIKLAKELRESLISDFNPKGGIAPKYFINDIGKDFINIGLENEWMSCKEKITQISQAPYLTALPKVMGANPIYGQMHREPIRLLKGNRFKSEPIGEVRNYKTRLLRFEEGINRLPPDTIFKLRDSAEFKEFRKKITLYNNADSSVHDVRIALENYKNKIDAEILSCFPDLKASKKATRESIKIVNLFNQSNTYGSLILSGMAVLTISFTGMNEIGLGTGLLSLYLTNLLHKMNKKHINVIEIAKLSLNEVLSNSAHNKEIIIDTQLNQHTSPFNTESFYDSVA
jgi:hypothetical protein